MRKKISKDSAQNTQPESEGEPSSGAARPVCKTLDKHAEHCRKSHCHNHHDDSSTQRTPQLVSDDLAVRDVVPHERAKHIDIAVSKVDQSKNAIDHRVAE